jgi:hypothetical protein
MRSRPVVLSACLLALTVGVLLAGVTAGSARQSPARICPQSADTTTTTTCCSGPPQGSVTPNCCTGSGVVCTTSRLTLTASTDPATAGSAIVLSGELTGASDSGQTIKLWQRLPGASSSTQTVQTTTNSGGGFSFTLAKGSVTTNRSWYVTGDGLTSPTVDESVSAMLTLVVSRSHGRTVLHGKVSPAGKGSVTLERQIGGARWKSFARVSLGHGSTFRWRAGYVARGAAIVRAMAPANADHIASFSRHVSALILRS